MSGFMFLQNSSEGRVGRHRSAVSFVTAMLIASLVAPAQAGPLEWLKSNKKPKTEVRAVLAQENPDDALFSGNPGESDLSGQNLDPMAFAKSHWGHAKQLFEKVCRAIIQKGDNRENADLIKKIFVIDTQIFKEAIKNSAMAVNELNSANDSMRQQLSDLNRVVTAPGQETLEALEKAVDRLKAANRNQIITVKKYLVGSEKIIEIGSQSYETLELIPSLAFPGTDLTVTSSKQLMKIAQSNAEAFKGLLLNVQAGYEQVISGLDTITRTVRETLRFSDHFAIRQFPLINLPAPSREKMYVQLSGLNNSLKNIANTLMIGDSQVRNTSQQFTHLVSALAAKAGETLKFAGQAESSEKAINQISNYAQNQVAGLYQRVKEDIRSMRSEMAAMVRSGGVQVSPEIDVESRQEFAARRTREVSKEKLPLFLLGGKGAAVASKVVEKPVVADEINENKAEIAKVLYSEKPVSPEADLINSELEIIRDQLGDNFFFAGETLPGVENQAEAVQENDDLNYEDSEDAGYPASDHDKMQVSLDNLNSVAEPEIELLKFDMTKAGSDSSEFLPMMRIDEESLSFEE